MSGLVKRRTAVSSQENIDSNIPNSSPQTPDTSSEFEQEKEQLTLMEQCLLLGLKDNQGTLSFWNDNISYVLRGCILIELSLRNRIQIKRETRKKPFQNRLVEVIDDSATGEVLLDEALRYMKSDEDTVSNWIDFLSGETWNLLKIGYQLKQVRERIAKGLVDKGVLRTEKKSFVVFDMATHPLSDSGAKAHIVKVVADTLLSRIPPTDKRVIALVCASYAANLLDNVFSRFSNSQREAAYLKADEILKEFCNFSENSKKNGVTEIMTGVLNVYSKMDTIL